jgi:hypothetical protein
MASFEHLDLLIGEAIECMDGAAGEIRNLSLYNQKELLKKIGLSIYELWEVRNSIYEIKPELKRDFINEYEQDKARYEELSKLHRQARAAEKAGEALSARNLYQKLMDVSSFGFFRLLAEAGLYRVSQSEKT